MARTARNSALETRTARARLRIRRTPYFAKIAKGLRLGYYRGAVAGSWVARCYRGAGVYATEALGIADDTLEADGVKVLDYWQAQEHARRWGERQRLIAEGMLREGSYTVVQRRDGLPRRDPGRKKPGRGARRQVCVRRLDPAGPRRHPGRKTDHRSHQPLAQQARDPAQARPQASGRRSSPPPAKPPTTRMPAAPARPPPTAS